MTSGSSQPSLLQDGQQVPLPPTQPRMKAPVTLFPSPRGRGTILQHCSIPPEAGGAALDASSGAAGSRELSQCLASTLLPSSHTLNTFYFQALSFWPFSKHSLCSHSHNSLTNCTVTLQWDSHCLLSAGEPEPGQLWFGDTTECGQLHPQHLSWYRHTVSSSHITPLAVLWHQWKWLFVFHAKQGNYLILPLYTSNLSNLYVLIWHP